MKELTSFLSHWKGIMLVKKKGESARGGDMNMFGVTPW